MNKPFAAFATALLLVLQLTGCTGGGGGATGSTGGGTTTPTPATLKVTAVIDPAAKNVISSNTKISATVTDSTGGAVPNAVVKFTDSSTLITIQPASGTALTNDLGIASVTASTATIESGAGTITADTVVNGVAASGTVNYSLVPLGVSISDPVFGVNTLSALGTTSVQVTVKSTDTGQPITTQQTVNFSSPCVSAGKASVTTGIATVQGVAIASYVDKGCANVDRVTASVVGVPSATSSGILTVNAPSASSIQFDSASPMSITLKGMGGAGRQESSLVSFKVVDASNSPLGGKTVNFSLSTSVGGITFSNGLTTASAISDATTGIATVLVNSGTVSTPVRVLASTAVGGATLTTQSDQLTITTGIPDQDSFSLSASTHNIEGWGIDGTETTITARLADHFNNPVPDGTTVNFTAEGGSIDGSCLTTAGICSVKLKSQDPRPVSDGRVTVLAYAVGEESFIDANGNGLADANEMVDINSMSTDMGEVFRDDNENGARDSNETYIDFNSNAKFDSADGKFSGVLCDVTKSGPCAAEKSLHVRGSQTILFSSSFANITISPNTFDLGHCGGPFGVTITVKDEAHNKVMPAGTKIQVATDNGTLSTTSFTVLDSTGAPGLAISDPLKYSADTTFFTSIKGDGTIDATTGACTDNTPTGVLTVTVTTPKGSVTTLTGTSVQN